MDYTLFEINKHKININTFSNKLMNTFNINEEIAINKEIVPEISLWTPRAIPSNKPWNPKANNNI